MAATADSPDGSLAESVTEHRDALEAWADSDLPLADDVAALLKEVDAI